MLNIKDTVVANTLVDQKKIETVLLLPDRKADSHVIERRTIPNCSEAFLSNGDQLINHGSFRYYACRDDEPNYFIESPRARIATLCQKIAESKQQLGRVTGQLQSLDQEIGEMETKKRQLDRQVESVAREINRAELKLKQTESIKIPETPDIDYFDQMVSETQAEIEELVTRKQEIEASTADFRATFEETTARHQALLSELTELGQQVERLRETFNSAKASESKNRDAIEHYRKLAKEILEKEAERDQIIVLKESELAKAVEMTKGERIETRKTPEAVDLEIKHVVKQIEASRLLQGSEEEIAIKYRDMREKFKRISSDITRQKAFLTRLRKGQLTREIALREFISAKSLQCAVFFAKFLSTRNFNGGLVFDHEEQTLDIRFKTNVSSRDHSNNEMRDLRSLSGGERSFCTVAFLLSLWNIVESPLLFLDEFDVFMVSSHWSAGVLGLSYDA